MFDAKIFFQLSLVFWVTVIASVSDAKAQSAGFNNYSIDQGLPSSQNYDIIQDKYGYTWFATDNGLSRYNGYEFENFDTQDGLTDNTIFNFILQKGGNVWCSTFNKKLFYIDPDDFDFVKYRFNDIIDNLNISEVNVLTCFYLAPDGSVFLSFVNSVGYLRIDKTGNILHNSVTIPDKKKHFRTVMCVDKSGGYFFFQDFTDSILKISGFENTIASSIGKNKPDDFFKATYLSETSTSVFISPDSIVLINGTGNNKIIQPEFQPIATGAYDKNHFWVGFRFGGFSIYDSNGNEVENHLKKHSVNKVYTDHEGGFWISTLDAGVFHRNNTNVKTINQQYGEDVWVNDIIKDHANRIWVSYYNGNIYSSAKDTFKRIYTSESLKPAHLDINKNGEVWYCVDEQIQNTTTNKVFNTMVNPINFVVIGDSMALTAYRNVRFYNETGLRSDLITEKRVNDICVINKTIYLATNNGLYYYENGKLSADKKFLEDVRITDLEEWNGKLLAGTKGSGLSIIDGKKIIQLTKKNGLNSNIVSRVRVENKNTLWVCSNSGVNRIQFQKGKYVIQGISVRNGLISNEATDIAFSGDTIWVGTKKGLCYFSERILSEKRSIINYFLKIKNAEVNDNEFLIREDQELSYDENRIEFNFHAFSFRDNQPVLYRYKLDGLEDKWNYTYGRKAIYSSLSPGSYQFIVQVKGQNSTWSSQQKSIAFQISPPYWQTTWFRLSVVGLIVLFIYLFFRYNILTYNRDIVRELLRQLLKRISRKKRYVVFREQGKDIRILTSEIAYVKAEGNYLEIITDTRKYLVRFKISQFLDVVPDPLEFLRINRSYIVRLDKIDEKSKKEVTIKGEKIPVGETFQEQLEKIKF